MALTMTRTRTQTALTKLVELLSNVKGELEYVEVLLVVEPQAAGALLARQKMLQGQHGALCATLKQFDAALDPEQVVAGADWQKAYRVRAPKSLVRRYLAAVGSTPESGKQSKVSGSRSTHPADSLYAKQDVPATTLTQPASPP